MHVKLEEFLERLKRLLAATEHIQMLQSKIEDITGLTSSIILSFWKQVIT